jgi:hypothetical protein
LNNKYKFNLDYEKFLLNDINPVSARDIEKSLKNNHINSELEELKKNDIAFFMKYPYKKFESDLKKKISEKELSNGFRFKKFRLNNFRYVLFPSLSLAAVILIFFVFHLNDPVNNSSVIQEQISGIDKSIRIKGPNSYLQIYRKTNNKNEQLLDSSRVQTGDVIQLCYFSANKYGMIFSVDGKGAVTLHYPDNKTVSALLNRNKLMPLNFSYKLDNARFERFYLVTSNREFNVDTVLKAAKLIIEKVDKSNENILNLPKGFEQHSILLIK